MKKFLTKTLALVAMLMMSVSTWAATGHQLTNGAHSITYYATYSGNDYTFVITSEETLNGMGGSFWNINGAGQDMRTSMTKTDDNTLTFNVTSTSAPNIYTPLYVLMPGEVNFGSITIEWEEADDPRSESDLTITSETELNFDLADASKTSQITYSSSVVGGVSYSSSKTTVATVSESGLITAVGVGTATITVEQAATETVKKGTATISVTVVNSAQVIMNYGSAGHFGNPTVKKVFYQFTYAEGQATVYLSSMTGSALDFAEIHTTTKGNMAMEKDGNGYKKTIALTEGEDLYFRFLYSDESIGGNEMTAETVSASDPNILHWVATPVAFPAMVKDVNFALASNGSSATATSGNAGAAIDGNNGSRWESASNDAEDWILNMGQRRLFNNIQIRWEAAYTQTFELLLSDDGENWAVIKKIDRTLPSPNNYEENIDLGADVAAQYVKFHGIKRGTGWGNSFYEFRVLYPDNAVLTTFTATANAISKVGVAAPIAIVTKDQNGRAMDAEISYTVSPADAGSVVNNVFTASKAGIATITAQATADGVTLDAAPIKIYCYAGENVAASDVANTKVIAQSEFAPNGTNAAYAVDGNDGSVWQGSPTNGTAGDDAARTYDAWFVLDLGANYDIELITAYFEGACSQDYTVQVSKNNTDWTIAYTYSMNSAIYGHTDLLYPGTTQQHVTDNEANLNAIRYVKFYSTKAATEWGMKMFEFKVFGVEAAPATKSITLVGQAGADYYATFSSAKAVKFLTVGATANLVSLDGEDLVLTAVENNEVPANTGVLIKSPVATVEYEEIAEAAAVAEANLLYPASKDKDELTDCKFYMLARDAEGDNLGFYYGAENGAAFTSREGSAYLAVAETAAPARFLINTTSEVTALENVANKAEVRKALIDGKIVILRGGNMFDLNGRIVK